MYPSIILQKSAINVDLVADRAIPTALTGDFAQSFVAQKNFILLDKFLGEVNGNLTDIATQYINFCDGSFDVFISDRINAMETEEEKRILGRIRYEINSARQKKLIEADKMLRGILAAGGLKQMEAKLSYHLRRAEIDMAFMVILQLNIEDAVNAKAETAAQVMTHLETLITEHQDKMVSAPVRLMRTLVRTDDSNVRKQMLRQKLLYGENLKKIARAEITTDEQGEERTEGEAVSTTSPQCEHIVVQPVQSWGAPDVTVQQLRDTISDVLAQVLVYLDLLCLLFKPFID